MINLRKSAFILSVAIAALMGCNKDEENPTPPNEEEVITTMNLKFVAPGSTDTIRASSRDLDGDGPNAPVVTAVNLKKGIAYTLVVEFLNESNPSDVENITEEVEEEGDEHQIFFAVSPSTLATHAYTDTDANGRPIGIKNTLTTAATAGTGTLKVTLKHQPGVKTASSTVSIGETDIEQTFDLNIID
jgi:hypothetical protein